TWFNSDYIRNSDEVELMQSTGLKDKNGVEIFEGDIVQWGDTPDWEEEPIRVAVVKINPDIQFDSNVGIFEYGRFIYRDTERFLTVLGNVYENPELLEVE
ncbi:YopX family protein, partial [Enterococcus faecium]